jgi:lysophospholipase L1-like esterase
LFVGSSSFRFWFAMAQDFPRARLLKRGFGGSQISDINFHFDRVVGRYRPARIAFYAGENDIDAGKSPDAIMTDLARFMDRKTEALGVTPVFYVSAKPSLARWAQFEQQSQLNRMVAQMANERDDLVYVDIVNAMMKDGRPDPALFISDGLHMKSDGYKLLREQIRAAFRHARTSKAPGC